MELAVELASRGWKENSRWNSRRAAGVIWSRAVGVAVAWLVWPCGAAARRFAVWGGAERFAVKGKFGLRHEIWSKTRDGKMG